MLSYIRACPIVRSSLSNLCFSRIESKEECLWTHVHKLYESNIYYDTSSLWTLFLPKTSLKKLYTMFHYATRRDFRPKDRQNQVGQFHEGKVTAVEMTVWKNNQILIRPMAVKFVSPGHLHKTITKSLTWDITRKRSHQNQQKNKWLQWKQIVQRIHWLSIHLGWKFIFHADSFHF